jgi:predicted DNA-binding WGR domain protein
MPCGWLITQVKTSGKSPSLAIGYARVPIIHQNLDRNRLARSGTPRESRKRAMIVLTRIDPARNMARFYALSLAPTLFGEWLLVKEWGRIGQAGTVRAETHPDAETAAEALARQISVKRRRGYTAARGEPDNDSASRM